jgi:hypothetical protein
MKSRFGLSFDHEEANSMQTGSKLRVESVGQRVDNNQVECAV